MSEVTRIELSNETKAKILQLAVEIITMHGSVAGSRICQDWSGKRDFNPVNLFTHHELDKISFNYELFNSNLEDYEIGYSGMHDEMVASFAIANELKEMTRKGDSNE